MHTSGNNIDTAVVLAAGYGKRLWPHTKSTPKPLLKFQNTPIIDTIFEALFRAKIENVIVVVGYLNEVMESYLSSKYKELFKLSFVKQTSIAGSAEGLESARTTILNTTKQSFLITASDYFLKAHHFTNLIDFHENGYHDITVSLRRIALNKVAESSYIDLNDANTITCIHEKSTTYDRDSDPIAASLIYILPIMALNFLPLVCVSSRGEKELPNLINILIENNMITKGLMQDQIPDWESHYRHH